MKDDHERMRLKKSKATPSLRQSALLATPRPHSRWPVWRLLLVLLLLLVSRPDWAAAQNPTASISTEQITDLVLFEDLQDSAKRLYLPRYRLAVQTVSGDQQYRARFYKQGTGTNLEVYLEKYPAPELGDSSRAAQELPHQTKALLRYDLPTGTQSNQANAYKELVFQEVTLEREGLKAVLRLDDLREQDALIKASEDPRLNAVLLVQRTFTVLSRPLKEIAGVQARIDEVDKQFRWLAGIHAQCDPILKKWEKVLAGKEPMSSVPTKEQLGLVYCHQSITPQLGREADLKRQRAPLEEELQRLRKQTAPATVTLDNRQPFSFDRTRHPYVFAGVTPNPGSKPQLVRSQLSWQDQYHSYFRSPDRADRWYYLPDRFVLAKQEQVPRLSVQFGGPPEAQTVELQYVAVPWIDTARLEAAKAALRPAVNSQVSIEPLLVDQAQLWVALPGVGNDGPYHRRPAASVDLRDGLKDQVRLTLEEFQKIYAALFSNSHTLFTGEVRLDLDGTTQERIPFEARVTGLTPEAFWDKVISQVVFADYQRTIQVKTAGTVFGKEVKALVVDFRDGDMVELYQDRLEALTTLRLPMREFILNAESSGQYQYKVTTFRERDGKIQTTKMPSWKTSTATILYPEVP